MAKHGNGSAGAGTKAPLGNGRKKGGKRADPRPRPRLPAVGPGRPRACATADEFETACREYIAEARGRTEERLVHKRSGDEVVHVSSPSPLTVLGLCDFLGIGRGTFYRYAEEGHAYCAVAAWFQDRCELDMLERLFEPRQHQAAKFLLQARFDYSERRDIQLSSGISDDEFLAALDAVDERGA